MTDVTASVCRWFCGKKILVAQRRDGVVRLWLDRVLLNRGGLETAWVQVVTGVQGRGKDPRSAEVLPGCDPRVGGSAGVDLWNDPVLGGRGGNGPLWTTRPPFPGCFFF